MSDRESRKRRWRNFQREAKIRGYGPYDFAGAKLYVEMVSIPEALEDHPEGGTIDMQEYI